MISLTVAGRWPEQFAGRVRGAIVRSYSGDDETALTACDAVALLEPGPDAEGFIAGCLSLGKHVLLAAPPLMSGAALERCCDRGRQAGVQLALLNPARFMPSRQMIHEQIESGSLGAPGLVRIHHWSSSQDDGERADLVTPVMTEVDLAMWLVGYPPAMVYAVATSLGQGIASGRSVQLHLGFPGGPMALIDCVTFGHARGEYRKLTLIGSSGAAYIDDHRNNQLVYRFGEGGDQPVASVVTEGDRARLALVQEFVSALESSRTLPGVGEWRLVTAVANAARRSAARGEAVPVEAC